MLLAVGCVDVRNRWSLFEASRPRPAKDGEYEWGVLGREYPTRQNRGWSASGYEKEILLLKDEEQFA